MDALLTMYRDRLTDLTARNLSLRLMRMSNKNHVDIHSLSVLNPLEGERVFHDTFHFEPLIPLVATNRLDEEGIALNRKLTQLKREMDLIEQETGMNPFYIAYGFLEGYLVEDFFIRSPLMLIPAKLKKTELQKLPYWVLELSSDDLPFLNRTLLLAIEKYLGIKIEEQLPDDFEEQLKANAMGFVKALLQTYKIPLLSDPDDKIAPLRNMKKDDIPPFRRGFELKPYLVMGKFQQSVSTLLTDYELLINNPPEGGLLSELLSEQGASDIEEIRTEELNNVHEKDTYFVLETDASQEAVVVSSGTRKGLVVHGPPGTGKSQVIVNLIADRLARNQKVLLVCQKATALDVVYNRLSSIQLHQHVALVHDFNESRAGTYSKIVSVIEKQAALFATSIDQDRMSNEMQALASKLNEIAHALHKERPIGRTLHQLYSTAKLNEDLLIDVSDFSRTVTYPDLHSTLVDLKHVIELIRIYDDPRHPWKHRKSFGKLNTQHQLELSSILSRIIRHAEMAEKAYEHSGAIAPKQFVAHTDELKQLSDALVVLQDVHFQDSIFMFFEDEHRDFENSTHMKHVYQTFKGIEKDFLVLAGRSAPVPHLTAQEGAVWTQKIGQFLDLNDKMSRFINSTWYALRKELQAHCSQHHIAFEGTSIRQYKEKIESFLKFVELRDRTTKVHFLSDAPVANDAAEWEKWLEEKQTCINFLQPFVRAQKVFPDWLANPTSVQALRAFLEDEFKHMVNVHLELANLTVQLQFDIEKLNIYLQSEHIKQLSRDVDAGTYNILRFSGLLKALDQFDSLSRLDQMKSDLNFQQVKLIERCKEKAPIDSTPDLINHWCALIENSFYHTWLLQIEEEDPHIKDVSTELYQRSVERYKELIRDKRKGVPRIINERLSRRAGEVMPATKQKLKSEASKKRRQATLRQIMKSFTEDLLKLIPCWLCTPESVSALFPLEEAMFDLVIFDEASQCPVENTIPAIYRAKQIVIAGDEKQLPPSSFFQAAQEEDDDEEEDPSLYVDRSNRLAKSLLEWAKPKLPDQWLTWHYRSHNEELINFSNHAFYGRRMQIASSKAKVKEGKAIEFIQVDGKWIGRQNRVEAEKVVDTVIEILRENPSKPSLGIITFNNTQAELINDVMDERSSKDHELKSLLNEARSRKAGEENVGLFVKNIENVQGDERDIIIFSVGYAENEEGKMVSQFGPLGQEGGENRLNVAITRAKHKVYLVCSFNPASWTRAENYTKGVRLLKRYLEYGKAVSDGNTDDVERILRQLSDGTATQELDQVVLLDSPFEEEVYRELVALGYHVHTQIGLSGYRIDLGIVHPSNEHYILGIECDGAMYHSSKVARERDIYRQRFLEDQGWRIHRIWSRNWWRGKEREIEKITNLVNEILHPVSQG